MSHLYVLNRFPLRSQAILTSCESQLHNKLVDHLFQLYRLLISQCFFMFNLDYLVHLDQCCAWNMNYGFEILLICVQSSCKSLNYYDVEMAEMVIGDSITTFWGLVIGKLLSAQDDRFFSF